MNGEALVLDGLTIESMGYLIFGQSGDIEMNGGVDIARIFDFQMRNGGETIRLTCDGQYHIKCTYHALVMDMPRLALISMA